MSEMFPNMESTGELVGQIRRLEKRVAELEEELKRATKKPVCAKCKGTGSIYRSWNSDYIDCYACDGRGM